MAYDIRLCNSIDEIPVADWDGMVGEHPFAKHCWFRFLEGAAHDYQPHYVVLYRNGQAVAGAAYVVQRHEQIPLVQPVRAILEAYLSRRPLLSCQVYLLGKPALFLPEGEDRPEVTRQLLEATRRLAAGEGYSFIVYDYLEAGPELASLRQAGLQDLLYPSEEGTFLPITWHSFEEYLMSLGHKRRQDLRRNIRRAEEAGAQVEVKRLASSNGGTPLSPAEQARVHELVHNVYRQHRERKMPSPDAFCASAAANVADQVILLLVHLDSQIAGCGFLLQDEGEISLRVLGLDYALDERGHVYRSLWHGAIRHAIQSGARRLDGGSTAYALKQRLGFQLERTSVSFTSASPVLRRLGNWLARF